MKPILDRGAGEQTELLLASIPSILIGVTSDGFVAHWNPAAGQAFGIPAGRVLGRPFAECGIPWDFKRILEGMGECRAKRSPIQLDDVAFERPDENAGVLKMTIIPVQQSRDGAFECFLFGTDVSEQKQVERLKNEFVSTVSHELRTPLAIIKEGVSQVLEGLLGEIKPQQKQFLSISLEGINRLGRIVDELLDISRIEAGKFELKRELVNIIEVVEGVSRAFQPQILQKGIKIKTEFSSERIDVYADKDRLAQVFTNLMSNALKFTEKGEIRISVGNRGEGVECRISDTGRGIAPKDLTKVFGKFQQFGRGGESTSKGTGLGLAICKGIVESHHGTLRVESQITKGTTFIFTLPRYTAKELFRQHILRAIGDALKDEAPLSILVFDIENYEVLIETWGMKRLTPFVQEMEGVVKQSLRRKADVAVKDTRAILVLLPDTGREEALIVAGRIGQTVDEFLGVQKAKKDVRVSSRIATFPEDGSSAESLLKKVTGR